MASEKKFIGNIKKNNEKAQAATDLRLGLLHAFDCIAEYDRNPELRLIVESLERDEQNDLKPWKEQEEKYLDDLNAKYAAYKQYKKERGIPQPEISEFEGLGNADPLKRIEMSCDLVTAKRILFLQELQSLPNAMISLDCAEYNNWRISKDSFGLSTLIKPWYHWKQLKLMYSILKDAIGVYKSQTQSTGVLKATEVSATYNRLCAILDSANQNGHANDYNINELQYSLQRVVDYTVNQFEKMVVSVEVYVKATKVVLKTSGLVTRSKCFKKKDSTGAYLYYLCLAVRNDPMQAIPERLLLADMREKFKIDSDLESMIESRRNIMKGANKIEAYEFIERIKQDSEVSDRLIRFNPKYKVTIFFQDKQKK